MVTATEIIPQAQNGKSPNSKNSSPVKSELSPEALKQEASTLLATGKRNFLVNDIPLAVSSLGEACGKFNKAYGETSPECGEAYFYYGKALLEMARLESGVLGNALDGVPEDEDSANSSQVEDPQKMAEWEKADVEEQVGEALEENFEKHDKIAKMHTVEDANEDAEDTEESQDEGAEKAEGNVHTEDLSENSEEKSKAEDEDPSNLQLAWEMIELAKVVYTKAAETKKPEIMEKLCDTYMTLGEISLENENYGQAVEDLSTCLQKRIETLPKDSRCIAETHYQLGSAQGFHMKWEESVASFEAAIKVLKTRITILQAVKICTEESKKEVSELEALIPDIREKITDTNDMKAETIRKAKEAAGFTSGSTSSTAGTSKPVQSISVKRKAEDESSEAKKIKEATI